MKEIIKSIGMLILLVATYLVVILMCVGFVLAVLNFVVRLLVGLGKL